MRQIAQIEDKKWQKGLCYGRFFIRVHLRHLWIKPFLKSAD